MTDDATPSDSPEPVDDDPLEGRRPCPDGNCLGVANADGRCSECGAFIGDPGEEEEPDDEERMPCPDGACIGVIGPDGRCTECGAVGSGAGADAEDSDDDEWVDGDEMVDSDENEPDDDERIPCPDGACIGIIDETGTCTECGRSLAEREE